MIKKTHGLLKKHNRQNNDLAMNIVINQKEQQGTETQTINNSFLFSKNVEYIFKKETTSKTVAPIVQQPLQK